jgi:hypothetical protein
MPVVVTAPTALPVLQRGYDETDDMQKVKSVQKKFRDSFSDPPANLNTDKWDAVIAGGGAVLSVAGGVLTLGSGTGANAESYLLTKETFTVPFRVQLNLALSQRIANQSFFVEGVSVDPATGLPDNKHTIAWVFDGTNAAQAKYRVGNGGLTPLDSAAQAVTSTAAPGGVYELEPFADEAWFHSQTLDAVTGRANSYRRHQQIPDPNALYKFRLRWLNGATPPASSTNAQLQFVSIQDYAELTAEITAGRGQNVAGQAIGVSLTGATAASTPIGTVALAANSVIIPTPSLFFNETTTNLAGAATFTGTSRDVGAAAAAAHRYSAFNAFALADQAGSFRIEVSNDNTTWRRATVDQAVAANTPVILSVPVMTRYHRVVFVNGASAQTLFMVNTSYTGA